MPVSETNKPKVRFENSDMEARLFVPAPGEDEKYSIELLRAILAEQGVKAGILEDVLKKIVEGRLYNQEFLVAKGTPATDGVDGYYDYNFNASCDRKPKVLPDGSVDYWTVHSIESVAAGQVIAVYHEAVQGQEGLSVKGLPVSGKRGRELPLLKGKGFRKKDDGVTYVSELDGKIEMQNDRIVILPVHELNGNAEITTGNIDFKGDIVIHGNVESGITVKATGSITIDGVVEACSIEAGKDIILRSGMLGGHKATLKTKGNIFAKFIENTTVEAEGSIQADVFMNCRVVSKEKITLSGKHGSIIGGVTHAVQGVEVTSIGNMAEIKTEIFAGTGADVVKRLKVLEIKEEATRTELAKIEQGLKQFQTLQEERGIDYSTDPRRMALLRARIKDMALIAEDEAEIKKLRELVARAQGAVVSVTHEVFPGTHICIDDARLVVNNNATNVEFYRLDDKIRTRSAT